MSFSFLFPGQGSQYNGMLQEHFEEFPEFSETLEQGEAFYKESFREIIFSSDPRISDTYYTQPLLLLVSYAFFKVWKRHNCPLPKISLGHSLGEISSLLSSGVFELETALELVKSRANLMIEEKGTKKTIMSAVLGIDSKTIVEVINEKKSDFLEPVNFNSPNQTVIVGNADEVEIVKPILKEVGARRVIDLSISVPSHSSLMSIASTKLKVVLDDLGLNKASFPTIHNVDAKVSISSEEIKDKIAYQISKPVLWVDCMTKLKKYSLEEHFELGPGKVLSSLGKQNRVPGAFYSFDDINVFKDKLKEYGK